MIPRILPSASTGLPLAPVAAELLGTQVQADPDIRVEVERPDIRVEAARPGIRVEAERPDTIRARMERLPRTIPAIILGIILATIMDFAAASSSARGHGTGGAIRTRCT